MSLLGTIMECERCWEVKAMADQASSRSLRTLISRCPSSRLPCSQGCDSWRYSNQGKREIFDIHPTLSQQKMYWLSCPAGNLLTYAMCSSEQGNNQWYFTREENHPSGAKDHAGREGEEQTILSTRHWERPSSGLGQAVSPRRIRLERWCHISCS